MTSRLAGSFTGDRTRRASTSRPAVVRAVCAFICGVLSQSASGQEPAKWRLIQEWRIGGQADGPLSFDFIGDLEQLPDGNLVHFDYKAGKFHILNDSGRPIRSFGRTGAGPGEVRNANGMAVQKNGTIVVNDFGNRRFVTFAPNGDFKEIILVQRTRAVLGQTAWNGVFLGDGNLYERIRHPGDPTDSASIGRLWNAKLSTVRELKSNACKGEMLADSLTRLPLRKANGTVITSVPLPYASPDISIAVDPSGFEWRHRGGQSNEIVKYRIGTCDVAATIRLEGDAPVVKAAERDGAAQWLNDQARQVGAVAPDLTRIPTSRPRFQSIHVDASGNVWVSRQLPDMRRIFEVFSRSGALIARVNISMQLSLFPSSPTVFGRDRVIGLVPDQDNLMHLVSLRIER